MAAVPKDGIFGSPVEPFFDVINSSASFDLLEDHLRSIIEYNQKRLSLVSENDGFLKDGKVSG